MERLRIFERKCKRSCINYKRKPGTFYYIANNYLYEKANIQRIDLFLVRTSLNYLTSKCNLNDNLIIKELGQILS